MRILLIHSSHFEYEVRDRAIEEAEPTSEKEGKDSIDEALVAFCSVESGDERDNDAVASNAAREISKVASTVKVKNIVVYPYAHLSSNLGSPSTAVPILRKLAELLVSEGYNVRRSPFGYYKSFKLECKGHPLSELSKTITAEKERRPAVLETRYAVLETDGRLIEPREYLQHPHPEFRFLVEKEALRRELPGGEPRYLEYCRKFGIEWEPYSDVGHMRYGPEGTLIFELITDYAWQKACELGLPLLQVRGTNMFDLSIPAVREHAALFGDRLYEVGVEEKQFVLRYAACHQQFSMVKDWTLSYRQLPFGTFELADSYRLEQSGELLLCFRVRKLHMPDLHIYCRDLEDAKKASMKVHEKIYSEIRKLGREYVSIYNTTRGFFEQNRDFFADLVKVEGKPVLLNFVPDGVFYWVLNVEYTIIDALDRPREIATFQIDIGNAERFGIAYIDHDGSRRFPPIIHTALIGTIERYLFSIFDCAAKAEDRGQKPSLPVWLSPIQARIVPVTMDQLRDANRIADELEKKDIRVDIDDREETVQKRVREAEISWIPYIIVLGQKEAGAGSFPVRVRARGTVETMTLDSLVAELREQTKDYPFTRSPFPRTLSTRPGYRKS
ncbi:threonine--tRNA ligase [Candidatus Bathyarchaeota archaeon]|nr:threonine--tRNA ligase [Candidatus Bathyarchaeota archaeon]